MPHNLFQVSRIQFPEDKESDLLRLVPKPLAKGVEGEGEDFLFLFSVMEEGSCFKSETNCDFIRIFVSYCMNEATCTTAKFSKVKYDVIHDVMDILQLHILPLVNYSFFFLPASHYFSSCIMY